MLESHDRMREKHFPLRGAHDFEEVLRGDLAEARSLASIANRLADPVRATIDFGKNRRQQRRALRAEFVALGIVMRSTVHSERLANVLFLLRDVVDLLGRLALRQQTSQLIQYFSHNNLLKTIYVDDSIIDEIPIDRNV